MTPERRTPPVLAGGARKDPMGVGIEPKDTSRPRHAFDANGRCLICRMDRYYGLIGDLADGRCLGGDAA